MSVATDMYDLYIQAEKDVLEGKTVQMDGRTMSLEDLDKIRAGRKEWAIKVAEEQATTSGASPLYATASWE